MFYSFTCILPEYVAHEITQEFWKNSLLENMTASFLLRCQNLLWYFTPEMMHFQAWKKIEFHKYCPVILIFFTKYGLYCLYIVFWFLFGMICTKDNFCFHEPIFHRQIKLISYRSDFWQLRRKLALLFSK